MALQPLLSQCTAYNENYQLALFPLLPLSPEAFSNQSAFKMFCAGFTLTYFQTIQNLYQNNKAALEIFKNHRVVLRQVQCLTCGRNCYYKNSNHKILIYQYHPAIDQQNFKIPYTQNKQNWEIIRPLAVRR